MTKCQTCHHGIDSTKIREGVNGSLKKIGHYCNTYIHYNIDKKLYTVSNMASNASTVAHNQHMPSNAHNYSNNYNKLTVTCNFYMGLFVCRAFMPVIHTCKIIKLSNKL
jgi:hypothetical protein